MNRLNDKGFSLIEILLSIAIAGILLVAIYGLFNSTTYSYNSTSSNVNIQQEAETTSNFIYELLIEATDVQVMNVPYKGNTCKLAVIFNNIYKENTGGSGTSATYDAVEKRNFILYDKASSKLYYISDTTAILEDDFTSTYISTILSKINDDTKLLAENVTGFTMTPAKLAPNTPMEYSISFNDGTASFSVGNTVYTRNTIATQTPTEEPSATAEPPVGAP